MEMSRHGFHAMGLAAGLVVAGSISLAQEADVAPRFETDVDVVAVDASVVDGEGRPVRGLTAADFLVEVDGRRRRVLSADFVEFSGPVPSAETASQPSPVQAVVPSRRREGRRIVIVVDRGELGIGAVRAATGAASRLLEQLSPEDRVALFSLPSGPRVDFTADRAAIETALGKIGPAQDLTTGEFDISLAEAADFLARRPRADAVVERECFQFLKTGRASAIEGCARRVEAEARQMIEDHERSVQDRLNALEALTVALGGIPGPKVLTLVSGGFGSPIGGSPRSVSHHLRRIATAAAAARVSLYSLYFSQRANVFDASRSQPSYTPGEDQQMRLAGLETLTGLAGGAMFEVVAGADRAFERVASEISGYYLLGLEPAKNDRDGKPHSIEVKVARKGVEVRARRQFVMNAASPVSPTRRARSVMPPPPPSPVRMTTHVMRGTSDTQIKVVVAAEVDGFCDGRLAVQVVNPAGGVVGTLEDDLRKAEGGAARWQDTLLLDRGPYLLKVEAIDGGGKRVAVTKTLNAELLHGVGFDASDLMLFERVGESTRLVAGSAVRGRVMPVYLELYVQEILPTDRLGVTIEIVGADGTRRGAAPLSLRKGGEPGLFFAEGQVDVWALPPGKYEARALVTFGTTVARRVESSFEVIR